MRVIEVLSGHDDGKIWKGLAAGLFGGMVAAWVMNQFQSLWGKQSHGVERSHGAQSLQQGSPQGDSSDAHHDATERVAAIVSENLFHHELAEREKYVAGTAVHYAFSTVTGGLYGLAAELRPGVTLGAGLTFGAAVWLAVDEGIIPALGLSKPMREYPPSIHAYSFASHLVYGLTTEVVRRSIRRAL